MTVDVPAYFSGVEPGVDGIWYARSSGPVSYPEDGNQGCFELEDRSFWFAHRNACIVEAVRRFPPPTGAVFFDIGGGNGFVSAGLAQAGYEVILIEPGLAGAVHARNRGLAHVVCATSDSAGLRNGVMGAVGLFDVIEHMPDETAFLSGIRTAMQPGARLYATVPAYPLLWSGDDVAAGHQRRHTVATISRSLAAAGLRVDFATYFFRPLPLAVFLFRTLPYWLSMKRHGAADSESDHAGKNGFALGLLQRVLEGEPASIRAVRPMGFGGSCLVVATAY